MRRFILLFLVWVATSPFAMAGNGSFLILKSTYLYQRADKSGRRILTRSRKAYDVVGISIDKNNSLMFEIRVPVTKRIVNGSGFIVETDSELQEAGFKKVKVYSHIPTTKESDNRYQLIQLNRLSFTGRQKKTKEFPYLIWRGVNYKANIPRTYWVSLWAGIYRPDKTTDWLKKTYARAIRKRYKKSVLNNILKGLVEPGFTKEQVRLSLGDPQGEKLLEDATQMEWTYREKRIIFKKNRVLRVL